MTYRAKMKIGATTVIAFFLLKACAPDRATWYGSHLRGKKMANTKPFDPNGMTAASWDYPLGTKLRLTHEGKSIVVEVTDRGGEPAFLQFGKTVDLTRGAFARLDSTVEGSIRVKIKKLN